MVKVLQGFLGFINFYRRFIWGFSSVAAPFMDLLKGKQTKYAKYAKSFNPKALQVFTHAALCEGAYPKSARPR